MNCDCWCCKSTVDKLDLCHLFTKEEARKDNYNGGVTLCGLDYKTTRRKDGSTLRHSEYTYFLKGLSRIGYNPCPDCNAKASQYKMEELY